MSVNVENVRKWVARLRDPEAKQARGSLRDGDAMCCLGHACDVSGLGEWSASVYLDEFVVLPRRVQDWLGVEDSSPTIAGRMAWQLNDLDGKSLSEIADLIEAEWPEVKVAS